MPLDDIRRKKLSAVSYEEMDLKKLQRVKAEYELFKN